MQGRFAWAILKPSLEEVEELVRWFSKMVDLLEEEVRVESEGWVASMVVVRSPGWMVAMEAVVKEF